MLRKGASLIRYIAVVITSVTSDSTAENLGIKPGDIIQSIGGTKVTSLENVSRLLAQNHAKGIPFEIILKREHIQMKLTTSEAKLGVTLGAVNEKYID